MAYKYLKRLALFFLISNTRVLVEKKTDAGERWDKKERKFFSIFNGIWLPNTEEKKKSLLN